MMNLDPIRQRLVGEFEPFRIHLSDGRSFPVPHPDFIAVGRGVVVLIDETDLSHKIDALHIASIDDVAPRHESDGK